MALKTVVDSLEGLHESLHEHYVKREDGKYQLDGVEDVSGLKSALQKERDDRAEAKRQLAKFKDLDPEKYQQLLQEHEDREKEKLTRKGEYDKLLAQVQEKHKTELEGKDGEVKRLRGSLEKNLIDAQATRAIAAAKGVPELLLPHVRQHVRVVEEDGEFVARVVAKDGTPRIGDASGALMSIDQLVAEMRGSDVFGRAFEGTGASGSGASNSGGRAGQKTIARADFQKLPAAEQATIARERKVVIVD